MKNLLSGKNANRQLQEKTEGKWVSEDNLFIFSIRQPNAAGYKLVVNNTL